MLIWEEHGMREKTKSVDERVASDLRSDVTGGRIKSLYGSGEGESQKRKRLGRHIL